MLEQKNVTVKTGSSFQTICPFPVRYIYQSYNSTSPANIYGGSWIAITGRFLYCNNGTSVGGSNTHTLSVSEMPSHNHGFSEYFWRASGTASSWNSEQWEVAHSDHSNNVVSRGTSEFGTMKTGSSLAHNNMPAYQTCYAWRRTN